MKKISLVIALLILCVSISGCAGTAPAQSTFKRNFSLDAVVAANEGYLREAARVSSGAETGPTGNFSQQHQEMVIRIDQANVPVFWEEIRGDVEQSLLDSNARLTGSELNGSEHFSFSYDENGLEGTVHVWGVPGEDSNFTIIALITEN